MASLLPEVILLNVRWYCRYALSYRDLEEMMQERGMGVDHSTLNRWVLKYAQVKQFSLICNRR